MLSVSVVVPCYNGAAHLAEALGSVWSQSRRPRELIVVDDGSTDGSAAIAESFGATVLRQPNRGDGAARNRGLRAATGDAIAWLDADDRWHPHHLAILCGLLERCPDAAGAFGATVRFGLRDGYVPGFVPPGGAREVLTEAFRDWLHTTIGSVLRRSVLLEIGGFDEIERYGVDFDLWLRLARHHKFVATEEVTSEWRWHEGQQSAAGHLQVAAAYRYRRRFLSGLREEGAEELLMSLEQEFARIWSRDVRRAMSAGDADMLRVLRASVPLVRTLPTWRRHGWGLASLAPHHAVAAAARLRRLTNGVASRHDGSR